MCKAQEIDEMLGTSARLAIVLTLANGKPWTFTDLRDDSYDVQFGSVDLANEIIPDSNSFGLLPETEVEIPVSGSGEMLWLFQNNEAKKGRGKHQADIVRLN